MSRPFSQSIPETSAPHFEAIWATPSFLRALDALTRRNPSLRVRVYKILRQYLADTRPLQRSPIHNPKCTIFHTRIDGEKRLIDQPMGPDLPREVAALYVGHHDDANNWGSRYDRDTLALLERARRVSASFESRAPERKQPAQPASHSSARPARPETYGEFLCRQDLERLHLPKHQLQPILDAWTVDGLNSLGIDPVTAERIEVLFLNKVPGAPLPIAVPAVEEPEAIRVTRDELATLLRLPLHRLLGTLTDEQRTLVQRQSRRLQVIKGAAGSGKTIIGIRRIEYLLQQRDLLDRRPILFICYNQLLADAVRQMLRDVLGKSPEAAGIQVRRAYQLVGQLRREFCPNIRTVPGREGDLLALLQQARKSTEVERELRGWTNAEILGEIREVILGRGITAPQLYVEADRRGRGRRLERKAREAIWAVFVQFYVLCQEKKIVAWEQMPVDVLVQLRNATPMQARYAAVIVDEAQDLPPTIFQLLLYLQGGSDDNFLILGDAAQNVYRSSFRWNHTGLRIAGGQVSILRRSFRSTPQIAGAAAPLVASQEGRFEDDLVLPEGVGDAGPLVQVQLWDTMQDEVLGVAVDIDSLVRDGVSPSSIGVLADSSTRKAIYEHLRELGCPSEEFEKADGSKRIDLFQPSVKLLTRGSAKGIEFSVLFLPRVTARAFPASDSDGEAADRARRDLYTAMMRCAWMLRISSTTGERSPLLDELKADCVEQVAGE